jgi:hypothetical protein
MMNICDDGNTDGQRLSVGMEERMGRKTLSVGMPERLWERVLLVCAVILLASYLYLPSCSGKAIKQAACLVILPGEGMPERLLERVALVGILLVFTSLFQSCN